MTYDPRPKLTRGGSRRSFDDLLSDVLNKGEEQEFDAIPFDEEAAEEQGEMRRFHSNAPTGADYSADYLNSVRQDALNALADPNAEYSDEELKQLQQIAATGSAEPEDTQGFWTTLLDAIDVPARTLRLLIADTLQLDQKSGVEIGREAYQSAINPFDNPNDLAKILGEEFVGEDGRFGGSKFLEAAGWDPDEDKPGLSGFGRWLADFGVEVALDPLTYTGFGLLGMGKAAATDAAGYAVGRAAKEAAEELGDNLVDKVVYGRLRQAPEGMSPFVREIAQETVDNVADKWRKKLDELGSAYEEMTVPEINALKAEITQETFNDTAKRHMDNITSAVREKEFDRLPQTFRKYVHEDPALDNRMVGGLRLIVPRIVGGGGARNAIGGVAAGGARKIRQKIKNLPAIKQLVNSRIGRAAWESYDDVAKKFASEQANLVAARNGNYWEAIYQPLKKNDERLRELGVEGLTPAVHSALTSLSKTAKEAGLDSNDVVRRLINQMESVEEIADDVPVERLFADAPELQEAADEFVQVARDSMRKVHAALKELDPDLGEIQGYVPRLVSKKGRRALEYLAEHVDDPAVLDGDTLGHQMLKAMLADQQRNVARRTLAQNVGDSTFSRSRELFGNAVVLLDESGHAMLEPSLARGFPSIAELNDLLGKAIRDVVEQNNLTLKLSDDFKVWTDDPQELLTSYFRGMEQALRERGLIHEWRKTGAIMKESRRTDIWKTVDRVRRVYNDSLRRRLETKYEDLRATARQANRILDGVEDVPREVVKLGQGVEIDLPKAVVEMPKVQQAIGRAKAALKQAADYRKEIVAQQKAVYNDLVNEGVKEELALRLALSRPNELTRARADIWASAVDEINKDLNTVMEIMARDFAENGRNLGVLRQLALDQSHHHRNLVRSATEQLERQWREELAAELNVSQEVVNSVRDLSAGDLQRFGEMARVKLESDITPLLNGVDMPDSIKETLKRIRSDTDLETFNGVLQRYVDIDVGARTTVSTWERIEAMAGTPIADKVLTSRRFEAVYKRAKSWLQDPDIIMKGRREELIAEFMFRETTSREVREVEGLQRLFETPDFLRAAGAAKYGPDVVDEISAEAAVRLGEIDDAFYEFLLERAENATKASRREVAVKALDDWLLKEGRAVTEAGLDTIEQSFAQVAGKINRHNETLAMLRQVAVDPKLAATPKFQRGFLSLADDLGFDPNLIQFPPEGGVRLLTMNEEIANFPTFDEIMEAIRRVADDDVALDDLTREQLNALPENVRRALGQEGVPEHIRMHENLTQYWQAAKREATRAGTAKRKLNAIDAAEEAWTEEVLPELRKVLAGKRQASTLRKKLWYIDERTGMELTDLGRQLRNGMPDRNWDEIKETINYLEVAAKPQMPRKLLAANKKLLEGTAFRPFSEAFDRLRNVADDIALSLTEKERDQAAESLELLSEFERLLKEDIFTPHALAKRTRGDVRPELPDALFDRDDAFKKQVDSARKMLRRLGLGDEADRFHVETTTEKLIKDRENYAPLATALVSGEATQGLTGSEAVRIMLSNMAESYKALNDPDGMKYFGDTVEGVVRWWKGMVTVTRATFHLRNLIGGVWNNQIADVSMREYAFIGKHAPKFLFNLRHGDDLPTALGKIKNEKTREIFEAMVNSKVLENSFARREFGQVGRRSASALQRVNPLNSQDFLLVHGGAYAMESVEGFLRAAAFARHYVLGDPDSARAAAQMVNAVHFDYSNLSQLERGLKRLSPFFVWTRRNIPLQLRTLIERPGIMAKYESLMGSLDVDDITGDYDRYPSSPYLSDGAAGRNLVMNADTPFWARVLLDPDLPVRDIMELDPLSPGTWFDFVFSSLGPQFTMPFDLREQAEWNYDVNAPAGMAEILKLMGRQETQDGDVQIPYWTRTLFETAAPYWREYIGPISPRDPKRAQRFGIDRTDGVSLSERIRAAGLQLGKAGGVTTQTPADAPGQAFEAQEIIRDIEGTARLEGRLPEEEEEESFSVRDFVKSLDF